MSSKRSDRIFSALLERFPEAFCYPPKPLAVGTKERLIEAGISEADAGLALMKWCRAPLYRKAVVAAGSVRVNLDGSVAGPVSDEEREFTVGKLKEAKDRSKAAKALKKANIAAAKAAQEANAIKRAEKAARRAAAEAKKAPEKPVEPKAQETQVKAGGRPVLVLKKRTIPRPE